jgi:hypothetical protein
MSWTLNATGHVAAGDQSPDAEEALAGAFAAFAEEHGVTSWTFDGTHVRGNQARGVYRKPAEPAVTRTGEYPPS